MLAGIKSSNAMQWFGWLIVLLGTILRLRQYVANRSLWVDEASLAVNIVSRGYLGLTQPLEYDQGAPLGFLFMVKLTSDIFGNHDYILRLFPFACGILSLVLIYRLADEYFGKHALAAVAMFSLSGAMVAYSNELKQYSTDVLVALLLIYLALRTLSKGLEGRSFVTLSLAGIASILLSHPAVFTLPVIGLALAGIAIYRKDFPRLYRLAGVGVVWGAALLAVYLISLRGLVGNENLGEYWRTGFAPLPPWENLGWYKQVMVLLLPQVSPSFFQAFDPFYLVNASLVLIALGGAALLFRNPIVAVLLVAPLGLAFLASALRLYPISERFLYFWFPSLLFLFAEGMRLIYDLLAKYNRRAALLIYSSMAVVLFWTPIQLAAQTFASPPLGEDIKPVLAYVRDHMQSDDMIYVHQGSTTPFLYYAEFYGVYTDNTFVAAKSWNVKRFLVDMENDLRGSERVWFIFSHVTSCDCEGNSMERIRHYVGIIDGYGEQLDRFEASRAGVYLYDLNP